MADHKALVLDGGQTKRVPNADSLIVGAGAKTVGGVLLVQESRTVTAGAGLAGGGDLTADRTLDVVANADASIVVNANDVQVGVLATDAQHGLRGGGTQHAVVIAAGANGFMTGADKTKLDGLPASAVPTTRTLTAGAGLTGGGDLSADRTFDVGAGDGILVGVDSIAADYGATIVDVGTAASAGVETQLAREDHIHALPAKWRRQHADFEKEADVAVLTATAERPVFRAEDAVTVTGVHYLPGAALAGDDADNATLTVRRRDNAGATPVTVASLTTTATPDNSFVAFDAKSLGALTNTAVAADEVLTFEVTKAGAGVVVPAGELVVNYTIN